MPRDIIHPYIANRTPGNQAPKYIGFSALFGIVEVREKTIRVLSKRAF